MGAPRVTPRVLACFEDTGGKHVSMTHITRATNLTPEQVRPAVRKLIEQGAPIEVVVPGQMWRAIEPSARAKKAAPAPVETPRDTLFEAVGQNAKGETIVKGDVSNALFKVVRL